MHHLTKEEFDETGLPESFRETAYWDNDGYLYTILIGSPAVFQQVKKQTRKVQDDPFPKQSSAKPIKP